MLQMRVRPEIKYASERVLRRIGLNLTEAMELFLRRVIVDQKLPFEVVALDDATLASAIQEWEREDQLLKGRRNQGQRSRQPRREAG